MLQDGGLRGERSPVPGALVSGMESGGPAAAASAAPTLAHVLRMLAADAEAPPTLQPGETPALPAFTHPEDAEALDLASARPGALRALARAAAPSEALHAEDLPRLSEAAPLRPTSAAGLTARIWEMAQAAAAARAPGTPATPLGPLEQYEIPDQLVRAMRLQWRDGLGEARLRLSPPQLGEVQVALQVQQGAVSAVLGSDSAVVRDWIRAQQHELKAQLAAQGLELEQLVVEDDRPRDRSAESPFEPPRRRAPRRAVPEARFEVRV